MDKNNEFERRNDENNIIDFNIENEDDKILREKIQKITEDVNVPESLLPKNILATIKNRSGKTDNATLDKIENNKKHFKFSGFSKIGSLVAAAAVIMISVVTLNKQISFDKGTLNEKASSKDMLTNEYSIEGTDSNLADNYNEVYKVFEKKKKEYESNLIYDGVFSEETIAETAAGAWDTQNTQNTSGREYEELNKFIDSNKDEKGDYIGTNVMTQGVDEADMIKCDGKYIYHLDYDLQAINVYETDGPDVTLVSTIYVDDVGGINEFYIDGTTLIATGGEYRGIGYQCKIAAMDITDVKNPQKLGSFTQEGSLTTSRKVGDIMYIITTVYKELTEVNKNDKSTYVPLVNDKALNYSEIYICDEPDNTEYTIISTVDTKNNMKKINTLAILGFGGSVYMGNDNIYLYRLVLSNKDLLYRETEIKKIGYDKETGKLTEAIDGKVAGDIKDAFAINEYKGYLRVMTTVYHGLGEMDNAVFVLDDKLSIVGSVENIAKNERIYSARYMGDVAYFVTYRETDPLFSVDLSNPESPRIVGSLKIPGFSEYLHGYGEGRLLGIGLEETNKGRVIKLSMFDITDKTDVKEVSKLVLSDEYHSSALYNYKAVMISDEKNLVGFSCEGRNGCSYKVFTYENDSFKLLVDHKIDGYNESLLRGVYLNQYVYIFGNREIVGYKVK